MDPYMKAMIINENRQREAIMIGNLPPEEDTVE